MMTMFNVHGRELETRKADIDIDCLSLLSALPSSTPGTSPSSPLGFSATANGPDKGGTEDITLCESLRLAQEEIGMLRSMDPFRAAEMAIELQVERMRTAEVTSTRDSAVQRLSSAYDSIKEKVQAINQLQGEKADLELRVAAAESRVIEAAEQARTDERKRCETEIARLHDLICILKDNGGSDAEKRVASLWSPLPSSSVSTLVSPIEDAHFTTKQTQSMSQDDEIVYLANGIDHLPISRPQTAFTPHNASPVTSMHHIAGLFDGRSSVDIDPVSATQARNAILAALPIPFGLPDDDLKPIMIPTPFSIHEFLGNTSGSLRNSLSGYRIFHEKTTRWCPEREEHGYFLAPRYKCSTKPKVPTAHAWSEADPRAKMVRPTECFYNREGKWYYAGQYVAVPLGDLNSKEWEELDIETTSLLIKETLAARKNTSPTVHFEVMQLYSAGALKISCVGLQCVGFNSQLYHTIMEQVAKCQRSGLWKAGWGGADFNPSNDPGTEDIWPPCNSGPIYAPPLALM